VERRRSAGSWIGLRPSRGILAILIALVASFAIFSLPGPRAFARAHLVLIPSHVWRQPWTLVTSAFLHPTFGALVSSGLGIWFFGTPVEQQLGRARTLAMLGLAALAGSLVSAALGLAIAPQSPIVGAQPATMAAVVGFGFAWRATQINLFGLQPMRASTVAGLFAVIAMVVYVISGDVVGLGGALAGGGVGALVASGLSFGQWSTARARFRRWRIRRRYRVIPGGRDSRRYLH
jgi:membrane associated rhomboid family serine protease